ncbi:hypothetical protein HK096_003447, partial [Nowakowskiella sp. JEL0078]
MDPEFDVLELQRSADEGRFVVAARDLIQGEIILRARPFGIALYSIARRNACHACFSFSVPGSLSISCLSCKAIAYCSIECQHKHYNFHSKYECHPLSEIQLLSSTMFSKSISKLKADIWEITLANFKNELSVLETEISGKSIYKLWLELIDDYDYSDVQNLARWFLNLMVRRQIELDLKEGLVKDQDGNVAGWNDVDLRLKQTDDVKSCVSSTPTWENVRKLTANTEILPTEELLQSFFLWSTLLRLSIIANPNNFSRGTFSDSFRKFFPTFDSFVSLIGIRTMNSFGLWDSTDECLGQGLYPFASYFNHSCRPNTVRDTGMKNISKSEIKPTPKSVEEDKAMQLSLEDIVSAISKEPIVIYQISED